MTERKRNLMGVLFLGTLIFAMCVSSIETASSQTIVPPKNLTWGMSYEEVKIKLETEQEKDRMKLEKAKEEKKLFPGFLTAKIKDAKMMDKEAKAGYAVFKDDKIVVVYFQFDWHNDEDPGLIKAGGGGRRGSWAFLQKLTEGFTMKYGEPGSSTVSESAIGNPIENKKWFETTFRDEEGNEIWLGITMNKTLGMEYYYVLLQYRNVEYAKTVKANVEKSTDY